MTPANFLVYNASAGSGKTYTLVKEYLKIILKNPKSYQNILAMTFTNKAANELKQRLLKSLALEDDLYKNLAETGYTEQKIKLRCREALNEILEAYSHFNVTTLDAFTYKIIRSFAKDLNMPSQFDVVLDSEEITKKAVAQLINKIGNDNAYLTKILTNFSLDKSSEDKWWDITQDLEKIAAILFREEDFKQVQKLTKYNFREFPVEKIYKKNRAIKNEFVGLAEKGLGILKREGLTDKDFYYGDLPKFFKGIYHNFENYLMNFQGRLDSNITNKKVCKPPRKNAALDQEFIAIYTSIKNLYNEKYKDYFLGKQIEKNWVPLAVLKEIQKEIDTLKNENNLQLNAEFNKIIHQKIKGLPSPFIYERLSQWISYFFIDEMQDTSVLQWENLIPLIGDSLQSKQEQAKLFLVGDAKQSIYRWRGGDPEQFIHLTGNKNPFFVSKKVENLPKNYRSYSKIVKFNNDFFTFISKDFNNKNHAQLYKEGNTQQHNEHKKGGYVSLEFLENNPQEDKEQESYPKKIKEKIDSITKLGYDKSDICVLVRKGKHGRYVADYLTKQGVKITSAETLLVKNSPKVGFLEALLRVFEDPENGEMLFLVLQWIYEKDEPLQKQMAAHDFYKEHLKNTTSQDFTETLNRLSKNALPKNFLELPLYETVEALVKSFNLVADSDSYVEGFLELVFAFTQKNAGGLTQFLTHWEEIKDKENIIASEEKDAAQIMTVHKSKGLEFPVVIFAYDLNTTQDLGSTFWYEDANMLEPYGLPNLRLGFNQKNHILGAEVKNLYEKHREALIFDNINILYVALTRAAHQLHIITDKKKKNKNYFSGKFIGFLEAKNLWDTKQHFYEFGEFCFIASESKPAINTLKNNFISSTWEEHGLQLFTKKDTTTKEHKGILWHAILAAIYTQNDIEKTLEKFVLQGEIKTSEQQNFEKLIEQITHHPQLQKCFLADKEIYTEHEIVDHTGAILIPDRLVFQEKNVSILEYKTGADSEKHAEQINAYGRALENMGYRITANILVYLDIRNFKLKDVRQV